MVSAPAVIIFFLYHNPAQELGGAEVHFAHPLIPLGNGHDPPARGAPQVHPDVQGHKGGGRVGRGDAVTDVAADGPHCPELGAAGQIGGLPQHGDPLLNDLAAGDTPESGQRSHGDIAVFQQRHPLQLLPQSVDGHQTAVG